MAAVVSGQSSGAPSAKLPVRIASLKISSAAIAEALLQHRDAPLDLN